MTLVLRPYGFSDRGDLIRVIDEVCGEGRWMSTARFEPTPAWERALQPARRDDHLLLLAADGPTVVGWCRLFLETSVQRAEADLGIGLLVPYRNRGIGCDLMQRTLSWAWSAGLQRVTLKTRRDNRRALRVFVRCGFEFTPGSDEVWAGMACSQPQRQWPGLGASAMPSIVHPTTIPGELGTERVWL